MKTHKITKYFTKNLSEKIIEIKQALYEQKCIILYLWYWNNSK